MYSIDDEAFDVDYDKIESRIAEKSNIIGSYKARCFQFRRYWLFFGISPCKTISTNTIEGWKMEMKMKRITVMFCRNVTGTIKKQPFVIGPSKKPCF